jgi:hypothetical protein
VPMDPTLAKKIEAVRTSANALTSPQKGVRRQSAGEVGEGRVGGGWSAHVFLFFWSAARVGEASGCRALGARVCVCVTIPAPLQPPLSNLSSGVKSATSPPPMGRARDSGGKGGKGSLPTAERSEVGKGGGKPKKRRKSKSPTPQSYYQSTSSARFAARSPPSLPLARSPSIDDPNQTTKRGGVFSFLPTFSLCRFQHFLCSV